MAAFALEKNMCTLVYRLFRGAIGRERVLRPEAFTF